MAFFKAKSPRNQPRQQDIHPDIRLVAIDLDGTLLNDSKQVSSQTVAALRDLPGRGVKVVIASARPPRSVRPIYQQLHLATLQINYNGALIWDEVHQVVVHHRPLAADLARKIIEHARARFENVLVTCEILDRWYTDRPDQTYTTETGRLFKPDVIGPLDQICSQPVTKLLLLGDCDMMAELELLLGSVFQQEVSIVRTDGELIQIMARGVGKSSALEIVAEFYQVPLEHVMAIGDAPNDVGMLQLAGVGVAMDNAHEMVKQVASWIAPSNNDHGVHAALEKYGLCGD